MMQCPSCGTANRLGAIFCRSCGAKLELDSITSETFQKVTGVVPKDKKDAKRRVKRIILNVFRLIFLGLVVLAVYLALQRPEVEQPETSKPLALQFKTAVGKIAKGIDTGKTPPRWKTSGTALNSYLSGLVTNTGMGSKTYQLVDTWVLIEDDGALTWVIDAKLFGRLLRIRYFGIVEKKDDKVVFTPRGFFAGRMGKLPVPSPLVGAFWVKRLWNSILEGNGGANEKVLAAISDLQFSGDTITVSFKP